MLAFLLIQSVQFRFIQQFHKKMFTLNQPQTPNAHLAEKIYSSFDVLMKSKNCVDKLGSRITEMQKGFTLNRSNPALKCVEETAKQIKNTIESKIESNFVALLNEQKRVNLTEVIGVEDKAKEEATKKLIQDYWQKRQENQSEARRKTLISCKENLFPKIKTNQTSEENLSTEKPKSKKKAIISSLNVKIYEKQKEKESLKKHKEQKILAYLYSYMVHVIDYKVQNDTPEFLLFQKLNYTKWDQIEYILKSIQNFCKHFQLKYCTLDLQKVMQLIDSKAKPEKSLKQQQGNLVTFTKLTGAEEEGTGAIKNIYSPHELLACLENCEEISAQNQKKAGIRFYGNKGKMRAIVKIQAVWRGKFVFTKVKKLIQKVKRVLKIQRAYRLHLNYCKTKEKIQQKCLEKYRWFTENQQKFRSSYRINELTKKSKYEIHICSDSRTEWQRVSTEKFMERQNSYLTRIFKIFKEEPMRQTRIIFITAAPIPTEILNYYFKLLELAGANDFKNRVIFMSPEGCDELQGRIPLTRVLYYCSSTLNKIRSIISGSYSYIVPSTPSIDFVPLCHYLGLPLYSSNPQSLLYLQTNSGFKDLISSMEGDVAKQFTLPYAKNIYSLPVLANQLTFLIQANPHIWRWILKIDNEHSSRGLAYLQVNKIIPKRMLKFIKSLSTNTLANPHESIPSQVKSLSKEIFNFVYKSLSEGEKLKIISEKVYKNQSQFLNFFCSNGGIVQAEVNSFEQETENLCFCVEIEPDNQWKFVSNYKKISIKKRSLCCYYDAQMIEPPLQIESVVKELIKRKEFGYFVFDFIKESGKEEDSKRRIYLNGMKCYLDNYSSASFMREFISKESNALYIPYIPHENIKKISMATFFHLCRLQNISFDIERKIGNIFMFLDGLESSCLGMMTFNDCSKIDTFIHAAEVLDFFSSKIDHSVTSGPSEQFLLIRNSINGYLNTLRKRKLAMKSMVQPSGPARRRSTQVESYKDKDYLL